MFFGIRNCYCDVTDYGHRRYNGLRLLFMQNSRGNREENTQALKKNLKNNNSNNNSKKTLGSISHNWMNPIKNICFFQAGIFLYYSNFQGYRNRKEVFITLHSFLATIVRIINKVQYYMCSTEQVGLTFMLGKKILVH